MVTTSAPSPASLARMSGLRITLMNFVFKRLAMLAGVPLGAAGCQQTLPYKGSSPAIADVIGGQVDMMFDTTVVAGPHIQTGKVRALAVTSAKRMESLPSVPTVADSGLPGWPGFEVVSWQGVFAPAGTPKLIIDQLHNEIVKILQQADMQERLKGLGMQPSTLTTEQFAAFQKAWVDK